jgi:membrane protein implicated in regulation of membrane protease activity
VGAQSVKDRVIDKLLDATLYVFGFFGLVFVSIGLAGDTPFEVWGSATGFAVVGVAALAVIVRRRSRRENEARGESSKDGENVEAEVSPVRSGVRGKYLEAMLFTSVVLVIFASYLGLGGASWKIWGSAAAVGIAGLVIGGALVRRGKNRDQERASDSDAGDSEV